jgi:N-acetylmuramoyl-L-alanine amidase
MATDIDCRASARGGWRPARGQALPPPRAARAVWRSLVLAGACALLTSCTSVPPLGMAGVPFVPSPNFDQRRPNLVILHHTGDRTLEEAQRTLTSPARKVSAHYLIGRDGRIVQLVDERQRAWHAGLAWWDGLSDVNSASIGIELDNDGHEPFAEPQIQALLRLLADLRERYRIPVANFIGHSDVAPGRKVDPSAWFPWGRLARQGFGLWCDPPLPAAPAGFDLALAFDALGYDPSTPEATRQAFLLHYAHGATLEARQLKALAYCLVQKKQAAGRGLRPGK